MIIKLHNLPGSIEKISTTVFDLDTYSKFKYGCAISTGLLSTQVCEKVKAFLPEDLCNSYFTSTPLMFTPSASHWLAKVTTKKINEIAFLSQKKAANYLELVQSPPISISFADYGKLTTTERLKAQNETPDLLVIPKIPDSATLVIVNDMNVTGAQQKRQGNLLRAAGVQAKTIWLYIYDVEKDEKNPADPKVEDFINNFAFPNNKVFIEFIQTACASGTLYITKRLLFKLFTLPINDYIDSIQMINVNLLQDMFNYSIADNMHQDKNFYQRIRIIYDYKNKSRN